MTVQRFALAHECTDPRRKQMTDRLSEDRSQTTINRDTPTQPIAATPPQLRDQLVSATLTQVVTGLPLATGAPTSTPHARCVSCDARLEEGAAVTASVCQRTQTRIIPYVYCRECTPVACAQAHVDGEVLVTGTLGLLARARTQDHAVCLTDVEVLTASPTSKKEPQCE